MCAVIVLWHPAWPTREIGAAEMRLRGRDETLRVVERRAFGWSTLETTPYHDFLPVYLEARAASEPWAERWGDRYDQSPSMATALDCEFASAWRLEFDLPELPGGHGQRGRPGVRVLAGLIDALAWAAAAWLAVALARVVRRRKRRHRSVTAPAGPA
jgi:hypothetical protein